MRQTCGFRLAIFECASQDQFGGGIYTQPMPRRHKNRFNAVPGPQCHPNTASVEQKRRPVTLTQSDGIMFADQQRFGATGARLIQQKTYMRSQPEPARVRQSLPINDNGVHSICDGPESFQQNRGFPET